LLRGQGIPPKATFGTVAMVIVIVAVPILAAAVLLDRYLGNREVIAIDQQAIAKAQETIDRFAADVKFREQVERQQSGIDARLKEVESCLGDYVQWSPVLMDLVENMPADMVMNKLAAETRRSRERVVKDNDPNRPVTVNVTRRTLVLEISGITTGSYDGVVRDYGERLRKSPVLGPRLESIVPSQKAGQVGDDKTVSYTMNLIFKAGS
jgi:Tfp pilus assembly protein PilN